MKYILKHTIFLFCTLILFGCVAPPVATLKSPSILPTSLNTSELIRPTKTNLSPTAKPLLVSTLTPVVTEAPVIKVTTKTPEIDLETQLIAFHEDHLVEDYLVSGIYVIESDGTNLRHLVDAQGWGWPAWSPDGQKFLFFNYQEETGKTSLNIYDLRQATATSIFQDDQSIHSAKWSPDEQQIVLVSYMGEGKSELYLLKSDDTKLQPLTFNQTSDTSPTWGPNSKQIAFSSDRNGNFEIYIMDLDTLAITQLTHHEANDSGPTWSPDGKQIAFTSMRDGHLEIYRISIDGTNLRRLTNTPTENSYFNAAPSWSPDSRHLVFVSNRDGVQGLYIMDASGQNVRLLYSGREPDFPAWQP